MPEASTTLPPAFLQRRKQIEDQRRQAEQMLQLRIGLHQAAVNMLLNGLRPYVENKITTARGWIFEVEYYSEDQAESEIYGLYHHPAGVEDPIVIFVVRVDRYSYAWCDFLHPEFATAADLDSLLDVLALRIADSSELLHDPSEPLDPDLASLSSVVPNPVEVATSPAPVAEIPEQNEDKAWLLSDITLHLAKPLNERELVAKLKSWQEFAREYQLLFRVHPAPETFFDVDPQNQETNRLHYNLLLLCVATLKGKPVDLEEILNRALTSEMLPLDSFQILESAVRSFPGLKPKQAFDNICRNVLTL